MDMQTAESELARDRKALANFHTATAAMALTSVLLVVLMFYLGVQAGKAAQVGQSAGEAARSQCPACPAEGERPAAKSARTA